MKKFTKILLVSGAILAPASLAVTTVSCGSKGGGGGSPTQNSFDDFVKKAKAESASSIVAQTKPTGWDVATTTDFSFTTSGHPGVKTPNSTVQATIKSASKKEEAVFTATYVANTAYSISNWQCTTQPVDPSVKAWANFKTAAHNQVSNTGGIYKILTQNQSFYGHFVVPKAWITNGEVKGPFVATQTKKPDDETHTVFYTIKLNPAKKTTSDSTDTLDISATMTENMPFNYNSSFKIVNVENEEPAFQNWVDSAKNLFDTTKDAITALHHLVDIETTAKNLSHYHLTKIAAILNKAGSSSSKITVHFKKEKTISSDLAKGTITFTDVSLFQGKTPVGRGGEFQFRWQNAEQKVFAPKIPTTSAPDAYFEMIVTRDMV